MRSCTFPFRWDSGGRVLHLSSEYDEIETREELLKAVTVLQHEAHRDGVVGDGNTAETLRAVLSHSIIAATLSSEYGEDFIKAGVEGSWLSGHNGLQKTGAPNLLEP